MSLLVLPLVQLLLQYVIDGCFLLEIALNYKHIVPLLSFGLVQGITNFLAGLWVPDNIGTKDASSENPMLISRRACAGSIPS